MAIKLGSTDIAAAYLGSTSVSAMYLGSTQVWSGADNTDTHIVIYGSSTIAYTQADLRANLLPMFPADAQPSLHAYGSGGAFWTFITDGTSSVPADAFFTGQASKLIKDAIVEALNNTARSKRILAIYLGSNDVLFNTTAIADAIAAIGALKAHPSWPAQTKIAIINTNGRVPVFEEGKTARWLAFTDWARNGAISGGYTDFVIETASDVRFLDPGAAQQGPYSSNTSPGTAWIVDGTHPTVAGGILFRQLVFKGLVASGFVTGDASAIPDTLPDAIAINGKSGPAGSTVTSDPITLTGIDASIGTGILVAGTGVTVSGATLMREFPVGDLSLGPAAVPNARIYSALNGAAITISAPAPAGAGDSTSYTAAIGNRQVAFTATATAAAPDTTAPTITSAASLSVAENTTAVATLTASEAVTWSIVGGADAAKFTINSGTGALAFASAPDYETPTDSGTNNVYDVTVRATDTAGNHTDQAIAVTVTDVVEGGPVTFDLSFTHHANFDGARSTWTITGASLGAADTNRVVAVEISYRASGTTPADAIDNVVSVTIGGVVAPKITAATTSNGQMGSTIVYASVPNGVTGDIVVTFNKSVDRAGASVARIITSTPTPSAGAAAADQGTGPLTGVQSKSFTVPAGGGGVGVYGNRTASSAVDWTNATEAAGSEQFIGGNLRTSAASIAPGTATVTATGVAGNVECTMSLAAWGP